MTHRVENSKPRAVVATPWWVRLATYVTVAIIGLVATALGIAQPDDVDQWLGQVGSLAALIGGLLAAAHTGKASDETPAEEIARLNPAGGVPDGFTAYPDEVVTDAD